MKEKEFANVTFKDLKNKSLYFSDFAYGDDLLFGINNKGKLVEISCGELIELDSKYDENWKVRDYLIDSDGEEVLNLFNVKDVYYLEKIDKIIKKLDERVNEILEHIA